VVVWTLRGREVMLDTVIAADDSSGAQSNETVYADRGSPRQLLTWCAVFATAVQCVLLVGIFFFILGMIETFREITASGESNPRVMAQGIAEAMVPVILAVGVSAFGILGSVVLIVASSYRARWFFRLSVTLAIVHILAFPLGTAYGIAFLVLLLVKRREFR
jgi:hypothetical protein